MAKKLTNLFEKHDIGKIKPSLIPPTVLRQLSEVLTYGASKYEKDNWKYGTTERYLDALYRHLIAFHEGDKVDDETGLSHMAHVLANAVFLLYLEDENKEQPQC